MMDIVRGLSRGWTLPLGIRLSNSWTNKGNCKRRGLTLSSR